MSGTLQALFSGLPVPEADQIFALTARFQAAKKAFEDGSLDKKPFTLGVGKFANAEGKTPLMQSVAKALSAQLENRIGDNPSGGYQPIVGAPQFRSAVEELVLGDSLASELRGKGVLASCQNLGGTGANFVQGAFLKKLGIDSIALSNPTWGNHKKIFPFAGLQTSFYRYYDSEQSVITYEEMRQAIRDLPSGTAINFHGCCHNPTGADLNNEQWKEICEEVKDKGLVAVFDIAYAGFGNGFEEDLFGVRWFVEQQVPTLIAFSFSKIASLYEERMGACIVALPEGYSDQSIVEGTLASILRPSISNPPALVSRALTQVLTDSALKAGWMKELSEVSAEIKEGAKLLAAGLEKHGVKHGGITERNGMFAILPFSPEQVKRLEEEEQVYMLPNGRVNVAAVKEHNASEIAERMAKVAG